MTTEDSERLSTIVVWFIEIKFTNKQNCLGLLSPLSQITAHIYYCYYQYVYWNSAGLIYLGARWKMGFFEP